LQEELTGGFELKMKFLMIYSNQFAVGNKPIGIASLAAILKQNGHTFSLIDCTKWSIQTKEECDLNMKGNKCLEYKFPSNPDRLPKRLPITFEGLVDEVLRSIEEFKPDIIGLTALTDDYPLGLGLMREVKRHFSTIPTIAGGVHASVDPVGVLSEDCFDLVCVGEGEYVVLDIAERIEQKKNFCGIPNLWIKGEDGKIERNTVRPYEQNLDKFPFPDWTIYSKSAFFRPYNGFVYKYGDFEMSRGCPYKCSYCINVQLQEIYRHAGPENFHREKSIDRVISEIKYAREHFDIEFLKFWDETFLLMSKERMEEFCDKYSTEIGLPYVIETTAESVTEFSAKVLKKTNCKSVSIGMETGNPDIRQGLLHKTTNNEEYQTAFQNLAENGVSKSSFNMIGLPNESQKDIFDTIGLNRALGTFNQSVGIFYPYKGTPIRRMMIEHGWMGDDFELNNLKGFNFQTFTANSRSVVRLKDMDSQLLNRLWLLFATYTYWPVPLYPLIDYVKNHNDSFAVNLLNNLQKITYYKKFGEWPPLNNQDEKPSAIAVRKCLEKIARLETPATVDFATRLVESWTGMGLNRLSKLIADILAGNLRPEFPLLEDRKKLDNRLDTKSDNTKMLRRVRTELRQMAKEDSIDYNQNTGASSRD
jgi:anaerobic magnesium-protoporphyrin IX monomethyl ester cyclase